MYAFAGIYDPDAARADVERDLLPMRRALELPSARTRVEIESTHGAGFVLLGRQAENEVPWVARDNARGVCVILAGELYARDELLSRLRGNGTPPDSDAELCLRLYLSEGATFVRHLNGHFNVMVYHEPERHLSIASDPFGYRPLFLTTCGSRVLFASEMKAILAALDTTPAIDGIGLLELTRYGWPLGERTWLERIRVATSGTWYHMTPNATRQERYIRFRFSRGAAASSVSAYVGGLAEKLRGAMQRAMADTARIGIALSGGLDSRALLLGADRHPHLLLAYTFGDGSSHDVRYAAQLARVANVAHLHLTYEPGYLRRWLAPVVWRTEGLLPFSEATFTSMHFHSVLARHVDLLLYGHAGDALTGAHLPHRVLLWRSRERLIEHVFRQYNRVPDVMLQQVFHRRFYQRFAPDLYAAMRATFADIDQEDLADVLGVWDMENRQRRGTFASTAVDRYRFGVRAPFLDQDLVDHLRQAPPLWRVQQMAYKQMITTAFPHAAEVPWSQTGLRLFPHRLADFATQARTYVRRRVRSGWSARDTPHAFRDLSADTRRDQQLAHTIRAFAASSLFPAEVFDRRGIEALVQRHWEGGEDLTHVVSMLATFAAAFQLFLWQRPGATPVEAVPAV